MSHTSSLSQRAVAVSALAVLLGGASFTPALADDGKDGKGGNGKGRGAEHRREGRGSDASARSGERAAQGGSQGRSQGRSQDGAQVGQKGPRVTRTGASEDPAGNNGTFKVDGLPFDDGLGNEPHVTCGFRLKFYGFDEGQTGDITIAGHAPSGSGVVSERTGVLISDDAAGGGPNDPDAIVEYTMDDLDLTGLTPHPKQGYHVKVTLSTDTPGGVKHKVFWIEPCAAEQTPTVGGTDTELPDTGGDVVTTPVVDAGEESTDARVLGTKLTRDRAAARDASVLGNVLTRAPLAFTGTFAEWLLAAGAGLVAAGGGMLAWARRRRGMHAA